MSVANKVQRLAARIIRLSLLAATVGMLLIVLDAMLLPDERDE